MVNIKWLKLVPDFLEPLNATLKLQTNRFQGSRLKFVLDFVLYNLQWNKLLRINHFFT